MSKILGILFLLISVASYAQEANSVSNIDWNGYIQLRATTNFDHNTSVMLRRLKFWVKSTPGFSDHLSYKVQVLFTSWMQERFFLQDARITYKTGSFSIDFGQFVPKYSLQRFQPDYQIASLERAIAVNALIPNGTLGVRDIGLQANYHSRTGIIESSLGAFNGYGIKEYRFNNAGYLITNKTAFNLHMGSGDLKLGYSIQYRKAENLKIPKLLPDTVAFSGNDLRYNIFAMYRTDRFELQAEYLTADLEGAHADGYYFLSVLKIEKSQIVLSYESYHDLIEGTASYPYYRVGWNYMIDKNRVKLFVDNFFQIYDGKIRNYRFSIQMQVFFRK